MTDVAFDRGVHHGAHVRARVRRAEQRATFLEGELDRAVRLIAVLAQAAAGCDVDPCTIVHLAELIDAKTEAAAHWTPPRIVELLRETRSAA